MNFYSLESQYIEAVQKNNVVSKTDIDGIITFVSDEFCKISKYSRWELLGQNHNIVRHPDVPKSKFEKLWETILAKKTYKATVKNLAKDGSVFYLNTTVFPILDKQKNIIEFIAIRYDITKGIEAIEALRQKDKELKILNTTLEERVKEKTAQLNELNFDLEKRIKKEVESNREKDRLMFHQFRLASMGEMLGNIAHQWRQPLSQLNIALYNMKKSQNLQNEKFNSFYVHSKKIIKNLSQTIDDFRNFFMPNKEIEPFLVKNLIDELDSIMGATLKSKNIQISCECTEQIEVNCYKNEFLQVLLNIINNSIDAFENLQKKKFIKIIVKNEDNFTNISIYDNAGGIKEEIIEKIFDPYFTTKNASIGTGIGLYMSKKIINSCNNSEIEAFNQDEGVCFNIKIGIGKNG